MEVAKQISKHFQDNIVEHPNTLMWGRKAECWEQVKKLPFKVSLNDLGPAIDFMPQNPANKFIDIRKNLVNIVLWKRMLIWNSTTKVLSIQQEKVIKDFVNSIRLSMGTGLMPHTIKKMKDLFMKAVRNGFPYKEVMQ